MAFAALITFSQKLSGLPPETVFQPLLCALKDNLVGKGLVLTFITEFFKEYLIDYNLDDLISLFPSEEGENGGQYVFLSFFLQKNALLKVFLSISPPTKEGMSALVEYNEKKVFDVKLKEMKTSLTTKIAEETDISQVIETVRQRV